MKTTRQRIMQVVLGVMIAGAGFVLGYFGNIAAKPQENDPAQQPMVIDLPQQSGNGNEAQSQAVSRQALSVGPNCTLEWISFFDGCGHDITRKGDISEFIGLTLEELNVKLPDCKVISLTTDKLVIQRTLNHYCPEHVVLRSNEYGLVVLKTNETTLEPQELMRFDADLETVDSSVRTQLEHGLIFETLSDVDAYMEDLES